MAFIRVEPVAGPGPHRLVQRSSSRDHVGRRAPPDHPARGRPRGGRRLSGHQRAAHAVRSRHAQGAAVADLPAPLAPLDGHRPRRSSSDPRRLTRRTIASARRGLGSPGTPARLAGPPPRSAGTSSGFGAGAPVPRPPRLRRPDPPTSTIRCGRARRHRFATRWPVQSSRGDLGARSLRRPDPRRVRRASSGRPQPVPGRWQRLGRRGRASPRVSSRWSRRCPRAARSTPSTPTCSRGRNESGHRLADRFLELADEDAAAYAGFAAAMKLPRDTEDQIARRDVRRSRRPRVVASEVPLRCVEACVELVARRGGAGRPQQRQRRRATSTSRPCSARRRPAAPPPTS